MWYLFWLLTFTHLSYLCLPVTKVGCGDGWGVNSDQYKPLGWHIHSPGLILGSGIPGGWRWIYTNHLFTILWFLCRCVFYLLYQNVPLFYDYEMKIDLLFQKKQHFFAYCEISDIYWTTHFLLVSWPTEWCLIHRLWC